MPVTNVHKEPERLAMTVTSEFTAPVERVWELWQNPRLLERWWGPPTYPATVVDHALTVGGSVTYFMTGPEGDQHHGWWKVRAVDAPRQLEFEDGFAHEDGTPNLELPTTIIQVDLKEGESGGTTMTIATTFPSLEAMEQMISMGMEEGMQEAMGQIDDLLAA
ncbi:MAG: SRPBCC family protein [Microthrixaceae bacterium]